MVTTQEILAIVKKRLGVADDSIDELAVSFIEEVQHRILHYCNIHEIPDGLKFTWAAMSVDLFVKRQPTHPAVNALLGSTVEIKAGDTTTKETTNKASVENVVSTYKDDLNHYRRLRW
jgi:hypothetical protein